MLLMFTLFKPAPAVRWMAAPTENDTYWRHELMKGEVHDPTAYILGGVSGFYFIN
jgi:hypothetical protein